MKNNFLPYQYAQTNTYSINHNYLRNQFDDYEEIFEKIKKVVMDGDFTLGSAVDNFEKEFAEVVGANHAIGVNSGTDALRLSLIALGIGIGDEVITTPYTFYATVGAIVTVGATPVFVDICDDFNIDVERIEKAITPKTKAILPVHWAGRPCNMREIQAIADKHGLKIVEDACHAIKATIDDRSAGTFGNAGCFSLHPLKNLNVWGDGGVIVTDSQEINDKLRLIRNHGLVNRDECKIFAFNSRLDTIQAVVASHLLNKIQHITSSRIKNASYLDSKLSHLEEIKIPARSSRIKEVFHIYSFECKFRDELQKYLIRNDVDAKIHYPIPIHLQPAAKIYGFGIGSFPRAESLAKSTISLPVHEFITREQLDIMISLIQNFYSK